MKKKSLVLLLTFAMIYTFALSACGGGASEESSDAAEETAVLKVKMPGGLKQGYHDLKYGFCFTSSYMPPALQNMLDPDKESFVFLPEFGRHVNERRLIIV